MVGVSRGEEGVNAVTSETGEGCGVDSRRKEIEQRRSAAQVQRMCLPSVDKRADVRGVGEGVGGAWGELVEGDASM